MPVLPFLPLAAYEVMPFVTLTDEQLQAIVHRHQLTIDGPIEPMPSNGVVHSLWSLGSEYVLRVPKAEEMCLGDLRAEVVAIPVARAARVRTPALVAFDDSCDLIDVPYAIVERVDGSDLSQLAHDDVRLPDLFRQLGVQLATLHTAPLPDPHPWFRVPGRWDVDVLLGETVAAGMLDTSAQRWFARVLEETTTDASTPRRCFLHNDVKPDNMMANHRDELVLIDWGDAGMGDPAHDLAGLRAAAIAQALVGYREIVEPTTDPTLEQRIVHLALANAVAGLRRAPKTGPSWYRPLATVMADLLAFATDHPATWQRWLGR
ncbi:MAG: aminoglycoside phosphotransferase family protein [Acidimicrobiia bacterium]